MSQVIKGRYTAQIEGPFVVFIIGMRINRFWMVWKWWPVFTAMVPMLKTLLNHPEKGFLHGEFFLYWRGPALVQYWKSMEDLERFARSPREPHLSAWQKFNRHVSVKGTVGIWHEAYEVPAGKYHCLYNNMPVFGLAKAGKSIPADAAYESGRRSENDSSDTHNPPAVS